MLVVSDFMTGPALQAMEGLQGPGKSPHSMPSAVPVPSHLHTDCTPGDIRFPSVLTGLESLGVP